MPRRPSREKSEVSLKLIELRRLLGDSQQKFGDRLGLALNTIARYETDQPPTGKVLLKIANVAALNRHRELSEYFSSRYYDEVFEKPAQIVMKIATHDRPVEGWYMQKLVGDREVKLAQQIMLILSASASADRRWRERAIKACDGVTKLVSSLGLNDDLEIRDSLRRAFSGGLNREDFTQSNSKQARKSDS